MKRIVRTWQLGGLALGTALLLATTTQAQGVPEGKADSGQTQRDRTPIDLSTIDKPKPEVEIFMGPDLGSAPPVGIVIVPDETAVPPPSPSSPAKEPAAPPKKKDDQ